MDHCLVGVARELLNLTAPKMWSMWFCVVNSERTIYVGLDVSGRSKISLCWSKSSVGSIFNYQIVPTRSFTVLHLEQCMMVFTIYAMSMILELLNSHVSVLDCLNTIINRYES